jgi:hypothetical protein
VRIGLIAVGVTAYLVLAVAILATGLKYGSLGSDYSAQARVAFALPVVECLLLVSLFAFGRTRRIGVAALGTVLVLAVWVVNGVNLLFVAFSSAGAP